MLTSPGDTAGHVACGFFVVESEEHSSHLHQISLTASECGSQLGLWTLDILSQKAWGSSLACN